MAVFDGEVYTQLTFLNVTDLLRVNGEVVTSGNGDVVGPASAVDNNIAVFDGMTGELIKDGGVPLTPAIDIRFITGTSQTVTITSDQILIPDSLYIIKDADGDASTDPVTVETQSTETIDGSASDVNIMADFGVLRLVSDGTNLFSW